MTNPSAECGHQKFQRMFLQRARDLTLKIPLGTDEQTYGYRHMDTETTVETRQAL